MIRNSIGIFVFFLITGCASVLKQEVKINEVHQLIDSWHRDAANADLNYFNFMANKSVYIGTAHEEVWTKEAFIAFAKPYFEKGKAWDFKPYERNMYVANDQQTIWFDEKLDTWMGICRGTGILIYEHSGWKLAHYTLSMAVPNECVREVISAIESADTN